MERGKRTEGERWEVGSAECRGSEDESMSAIERVLKLALSFHLSFKVLSK